MASTDFIDFVHQLADASGAILRDSFRQPELQATLKADASPVTQADRTVEARLREMIQDTFPDHGILGEEFDPHQPNAPYQWVLDPIDGTRAFACGVPTFSTLIGLLHHGIPVLGVLDQPITRERWIGGVGDSTYHTSRITTLAQARLATTSPYLFTDTQRPAFERLRRTTAIQNFGGDGYNYALLASGHIDLMIEAGLKPYDLLPLLPILSDAGAGVTDWNGQPLDLKAASLDVLVSANDALHQQALALMNKT